MDYYGSCIYFGAILGWLHKESCFLARSEGAFGLFDSYFRLESQLDSSSKRAGVPEIPMAATVGCSSQRQGCGVDSTFPCSATDVALVQRRLRTGSDSEFTTRWLGFLVYPVVFRYLAPKSLPYERSCRVNELL